MTGHFDEFCRRALGCDGAMRSARVADSFGGLVGGAYREGLAHMKDDEEERYTLASPCCAPPCARISRDRKSVV